MKKNKPEAAAIKADEKKPESKNEAEVKFNNQPIETVDSIRVRKDSTELTFKKVLHGYDPQEVLKFINEQSSNYASTSRIYESKVSEVKSELALAYRERDSLRDELFECKKALSERPVLDADVAEPSNTVDEAEFAAEMEAKEHEYEQIIEGLNARIAKAEHEVERLEKFEEETEKLSEDNAKLSADNAQIRQKNSDLKLEIAKLSEKASEIDELIAEKETVKAAMEELETRHNELSGEYQAKSELLDDVNTENDKLRRELSELGIKYSILQQKSEKSEAEVLQLKEVNKKQSYDFAEKINDAETHYTTERLSYQKKIQVHSYHVKQFNMMMDEMKKQMTELQKSLDDIENTNK